MEKRDNTMLYILLVAVAVVFLYPLVFRPAYAVSYKGPAEYETYVKETQEEMRGLGIRRIRWTGDLVHINDPNLMGRMVGWQSIPVYLGEKPILGFLLIQHIEINPHLNDTPEETRLTIRKELLGNSVAADWCIKFKCKQKYGEPEWQIIADGLGLLYLASEFNNTEFVGWDGETMNCEILIEIDRISNKNYINSGGIPQTLEKYCGIKAP